MLDLQTVYLSKHDLASFIVNTPDPTLFDPPIGQKLILTCSLAKKYFYLEDIYILLKIRFHDNSELEKRIKVGSPSGIYTYYLLNDEFLEKKGILTYKAELYHQSQLIDCWRHQLWVDLITIRQAETSDEEETCL